MRKLPNVLVDLHARALVKYVCNNPTVTDNGHGPVEEVDLTRWPVNTFQFARHLDDLALRPDGSRRIHAVEGAAVLSVARRRSLVVERGFGVEDVFIYQVVYFVVDVAL